MNQILLETRMFWLSDGEEIMTLAFLVLMQYRSVTDIWTVGRTDICALAIPALAYLLCYGCYRTLERLRADASF